MQLPVLNTSGIDITNTVANIDAMRTRDMQRQNLQSEIDTRIAQAPVANAMKVMEMKKAAQEIASNKQKQDKDQLDAVASSTAFIEGLPSESQETAWNDMQQTYNQKGITNLPSADVFKINGIWSPAKFKTMSQAGIRARKLELDPTVGGTPVSQMVANPSFDKTKEEGPDNPALVERKYVSQGIGKYTPVEGIPDKPVENFYTKQKIEQQKVAAQEAHTKVLEAATAVRDKETSTYRMGMLSIAQKNAATSAVKAEGEDWYAVGPTEDQKSIIMHNRKTGTVKTTVIPNEAKLGAKPKIEGEADKMLREFNEKRKGKTLKPATKVILDTYAASGKYKTKQEVLDAAKTDGYDTKGF